MTNRQIKFRFWNKIARRFQPASKYAIDGDGKLVAYDYEMHEYNDPVDFSKTIIVAQQYTGLKDESGEEIYEGDILHYVFDGASYPKEAKDEILTCLWGTFGGMYSFENKDSEYYWAEIANRCSVVGNIFENPELLEK